MSSTAPSIEKVVIDGPAGAIEAMIERPEDARADIVAVCCHPHPLYGGTMQNKVVHTMARACQDQDVVTVRFNFRGVGASAGKHDDGVGETQYFLRTRGGELRLYFDKDPDLLPGTALRVTGEAMEDGLRVDTYQIEQGLGVANQSLISAPAYKARSFAFVLVDTGSGVNLSKADAQKRLFGTSPGDKSVKQYYNEVSYGTQDITGEVIGPLSYRMVGCDTRGLARLGGTLRFSDLDTLPRVTGTYLLQCGAANPRGIVTWTGVRFSDVADMLGLMPNAHYCRFVASDRHYVDEPMSVLRHPQVMLVWMMNGAPLAPRHGAPLRLVMPFRYGNRSIKAVTEILFGTPALPAPPVPV